jgi:hypothetical protein
MLTFYNAASKNIGPNPDQFRDCIDIAVKLAFGFEKHEGPINPAKLQELTVVQEITNQPKINMNLLDTTNNLPLRILQASENTVRTKINILVELLSNHYNVITQRSTNGDFRENFHTLIYNAFAKNYEYYSYQQAISDLAELYRNGADSFINIIKDSSKPIVMGENVDL